MFNMLEGKQEMRLCVRLLGQSLDAIRNSITSPATRKELVREANAFKIKKISVFVLFHERVHVSCLELQPVVIRWPDTVSKRLMQRMSHTIKKNTKSSLCYVNTTKQTMGMILFPSK